MIVALPTRPMPKLAMLGFMAELAYAMETIAKRANGHADEERAAAPYSTARQDRAHDACRETAKLVDDSIDNVYEMEDAIYDATRGVS